MALNHSYGCCDFFTMPPCSNIDCFCDQDCHVMNDCCSDIADIGCHPASSTSTDSPNSTITHGKTKCSHSFLNKVIMINKQYIFSTFLNFMRIHHFIQNLHLA